MPKAKLRREPFGRPTRKSEISTGVIASPLYEGGQKVNVAGASVAFCLFAPMQCWRSPAINYQQLSRVTP